MPDNWMDMPVLIHVFRTFCVLWLLDCIVDTCKELHALLDKPDAGEGGDCMAVEQKGGE